MILEMHCRLFVFLLVGVSCGQAQVTGPDTPAGHRLQAWLDAFNSGDRARIETYVKTVDQSQSVDGMISFRSQTGGFDLLSIESSELLHIRFRVKEKSGQITALGNLLVKDGQPPTVGTFGLRALPPGAVLENVTMDAPERKKVIGAVAVELKEFYVEPAAAQQMADALNMHENNGDYDAISDGDVFAARLTKDLQDVSHDKHLRVDLAPSKYRREESLLRKTRRAFTNRWNTTTARSTKLRSCPITSAT
jgi:hypothetical protein